jgi:hypothetical protein
MSAICSNVGTYTQHNSLLSIFSLLKWKCVAMCFVLGFIFGLTAIRMLASLSHMIGIGFVMWSPRSRVSFSSQQTSLVAVEIPIYSASEEESTTVGCFFYNQVIGPFPSLKTKPMVDCAPSTSPAQSMSVYPEICNSASWF